VTYRTSVLVPERSTVFIEGSSSLHPLHAKATGAEGRVEASVTKTGVRIRAGGIRVPVSLLRSGNPLVDRETRRRIDANAFPEISGTLTAATPTGPGALAAAGELTFRGETRPVTGALDVVAEDDGLHITGRARFDVRDWGLDLPRLGLLKVHPDIVVSIDLWAVPEP